jgi:histone-lysine N-methyltransferase SETMAR
MEEFKFTTSQTSVASEVKCQDVADFFFDANGIVHSEFVPNGQTVNQEFYLQVLKSLRDAVRRKHPELWQSGEWWLFHNNAPAHKALSVKQFLTKKSMTLLLHPPNSPDLAPCDIFFIPLN